MAVGFGMAALVGIPIGGAIQVVVRELRRGPDGEADPSELGTSSAADPVDI